MKKQLMLLALSLALFAAGTGLGSAAHAADKAADTKAETADAKSAGKSKKPVTLSQARERAKKRLDRLNNMTEEEWNAAQKKKADRRQFWNTLSDSEKREMKSCVKDHRISTPAADPDQRYNACKLKVKGK